MFGSFVLLCKCFCNLRLLFFLIWFGKCSKTNTFKGRISAFSFFKLMHPVQGCHCYTYFHVHSLLYVCSTLYIYIFKFNFQPHHLKKKNPAWQCILFGFSHFILFTLPWISFQHIEVVNYADTYLPFFLLLIACKGMIDILDLFDKHTFYLFILLKYLSHSDIINCKLIA